KRALPTSVAQAYDQRPVAASKRERKASPIIGLKTANNMVVRDLIRYYTPKDAIVLEPGCGVGGAIWKWDAARVWRYYGFDVSSRSVERARKRVDKQWGPTKRFQFSVG